MKHPLHLLALLAISLLPLSTRADDSLLTLDRIFVDKEFDAKSFGPAKWLDDGSGYTVLEKSEDHEDAKDTVAKDTVAKDTVAKDLVRYDAESGERTVLVAAERLIPAGDTAPLTISSYAWSTDRGKLLIFTNTRRVWRRNTRGDYWVLDLQSGRLRQLGGDAEESTLMFAKFSPQGDRVAYVCEKNVYVQNLDSFRITQLTTRQSDTIINGTSDWVYEEELDVRDGFRWSPDGRKIAFWQFDCSGVPEFHLINYTDELYPKIQTFAYPKVGQTNSICRVGVVDAGGGEARWFEPTDDLRNHYISRLDWTTDSQQIVMQHLNRLQNTMKTLLGDVQTGRIRTLLIDRDDAWVDVRYEPKWTDDGRYLVWLSERNGWQQMYRTSRISDETAPLTRGPFDVISLEQIDENNGRVYFTASPENPTQRYLFYVDLDGNSRPRRVTPADQPGTHSYQISPDGRWAIHTYSNINRPPVTELVRLPSHETVRVLEDNAELRAKVAQLRRVPTEMFRVEIGDGVALDGWCIKPPEMQPGKKYPLFFYVYGEPAGATVKDSWHSGRAMWYTMLAQHGYVVVSIDNRGTRAPRGREWRKCIYRQIGILASADQAAATRELIEQWPFIDAERIGITGASGGGSMSLNAIFRYPDLYHTAMARSFISNQRFYDTIYQERYMGLPDDNDEGYTNGSPITFAKQLEGNLLLVHGTADDNCHYQSCEAMINELIEQNKQFSMMSYPNRTHSISGGNTRRHLYGLLTKFLEDHMPPGPR
ncbi:MAG TPA: S9 family peptidase [Thermoguttaceae bacterium]|nr:S9 family peptidase [Thermoguttaceae bacterium]